MTSLVCYLCFCCSIVAGSRESTWGTVTPHIYTPFPNPSSSVSLPPSLPVMNFNHLTSMTLTFSYSKQPSHPLMCDLWSILSVVNLGWQRVVPCLGVRLNNQAWDRSLGTHLEIKRWSEMQTEKQKVSPDMLGLIQPALRSKYLAEIDRVSSGVLTTVASCSGTAARLNCLIWNASRASSKFFKWAYLERLIHCNASR